MRTLIVRMNNCLIASCVLPHAVGARGQRLVALGIQFGQSDLHSHDRSQHRIVVPCPHAGTPVILMPCFATQKRFACVMCASDTAPVGWGRTSLPQVQGWPAMASNVHPRPALRPVSTRGVRHAGRRKSTPSFCKRWGCRRAFQFAATTSRRAPVVIGATTSGHAAPRPAGTETAHPSPTRRVQPENRETADVRSDRPAYGNSLPLRVPATRRSALMLPP